MGTYSWSDYKSISLCLHKESVITPERKDIEAYIYPFRYNLFILSKRFLVLPSPIRRPPKFISCAVHLSSCAVTAAAIASLHHIPRILFSPVGSAHSQFPARIASQTPQQNEQQFINPPPFVWCLLCRLCISPLPRWTVFMTAFLTRRAQL